LIALLNGWRLDDKYQSLCKEANPQFLIDISQCSANA